jgi:hypothetical protein
MNRPKECRKTIQFTISSKSKIPRNKLNKGCERPLSGKLQTTEKRNGRRLQRWNVLAGSWISRINIV